MRIVASLLMLAGATNPAASTRVVRSGLVTIWPKGSQARIHLCSRPEPAPAEDGWTPGWRDVARIETLLPAAMREWRIANGNVSPYDAPRFEDVDWEHSFARNYFGLVRGGKKLVYIDFAPRGLRDGFGVCDGGASFFGIEMDAGAMRVLTYRKNGA